MKLLFGAGPRWNNRMVVVIALFMGNYGQAQTGSNLRLGFENLYSTHGDHFPGISVSCHMLMGAKWELGAGMEYSHARTHDDNGWNLYRLHFLPLYISTYYNGLSFGNWALYLHLQGGLSFINYYKEYQDHPDERHYIHEYGLYGFAGIGTHYYFSKRSGLFAETGLKGFHLSFNNLDINPHGLTAKLGYVYRLK